MKEFHIISSGVSIITNAQRKGLVPADIKISDEVYWNSLLSNPAKINEIIAFVREAPMERSAELNTFLRVVENKETADIEVYLFGTKTSSNELCRTILGLYLKERGIRLYTPIEVSGYFWEAKYDEKYAIKEFEKGIIELLDRLIHLAKKKIEEGYRVYFNPTGGLKAHVIATALVGFLMNADIYYMNEEFNEVVFLPPLFYIPKGKELEILHHLHSTSILSGKKADEILSNSPDEIDRLSLYGLISSEVDDETDRTYRIRITNKGKLLLDKLGVKT